MNSTLIQQIPVSDDVNRRFLALCPPFIASLTTKQYALVLEAFLCLDYLTKRDPATFSTGAHAHLKSGKDVVLCVGTGYGRHWQFSLHQGRSQLEYSFMIWESMMIVACKTGGLELYQRVKMISTHQLILTLRLMYLSSYTQVKRGFCIGFIIILPHKEQYLRCQRVQKALISNVW